MWFDLGSGCVDFGGSVGFMFLFVELGGFCVELL